jgi:hypothetical protein
MVGQSRRGSARKRGWNEEEIKKNQKQKKSSENDNE